MVRNMRILCDFHLHSCLSPCGDLAMSPRTIAGELAKKGVVLAALTDHNTALNCPAFAEACKQAGITPLFGMEAQSQEEIHMLCLFSSLETALLFSNEIYNLLPPVLNDPDKTGDQVYVDEEENIIGEVEKYLITSADIPIDELAARVHSLGGLAIPAHADRSAFSLTSQFGMITDGDWDAIELVRIPADITQDTLHRYPLTTSSDAHYIEHIARRPFELDMQNLPLMNTDGTVNIENIRSALRRRLF